jgi:hypothetical protein
MFAVSLKLLNRNFLKGLRTNTNFMRTNRVPTEMRTGFLLNASPKHYRLQYFALGRVLTLLH